MAAFFFVFAVIGEEGGFFFFVACEDFWIDGLVGGAVVAFDLDEESLDGDSHEFGSGEGGHV